ARRVVLRGGSPAGAGGKTRRPVRAGDLPETETAVAHRAGEGREIKIREATAAARTGAPPGGAGRNPGFFASISRFWAAGTLPLSAVSCRHAPCLTPWIRRRGP